MQASRGNRFDVPIGVAPGDEFAFWRRVAPRIAADLDNIEGPPIRVVVVADEGDKTSAHLELRHTDYTVPIFVEVNDDGEEKAVIEVFEAVLDSAVFDDVFEPWPPCPRHSVAAGHSLAPALSQGQAVWQCPADCTVVAVIGMLHGSVG